jgi:hypothetical protein
MEEQAIGDVVWAMVVEGGLSVVDKYGAVAPVTRRHGQSSFTSTMSTESCACARPLSN